MAASVFFKPKLKLGIVGIVLDKFVRDKLNKKHIFKTFKKNEKINIKVVLQLKKIGDMFISRLTTLSY